MLVAERTRRLVSNRRRARLLWRRLVDECDQMKSVSTLLLVPSLLLLSVPAFGAQYFTDFEELPDHWIHVPSYWRTSRGTWDSQNPADVPGYTGALRWQGSSFGLIGNLSQYQYYFGNQGARVAYQNGWLQTEAANPTSVVFWVSSNRADDQLTLELQTASASDPTSWTTQLSVRNAAGDSGLNATFMYKRVGLAGLSGARLIRWILSRGVDTSPYFYVDNITVYTDGTAPPELALRTLDEIDQSLEANPPLTPMIDYPGVVSQRKSAMRDLDNHARTYGSQYLADGTVTTPFTSHYRNRIDKIISELQTVRPQPDEILIWKGYSSGFIVRSPRSTFAIDFCEGPNNMQPQTGEDINLAYSMTEAQLDAIASQLNCAFGTHFHHDHVSLPLAASMIAKGKPYYSTATTTPYGCTDPWTDNHATLDIGPLKVTIYKGRQADISGPGVDNYIYHIETDNGISVIHGGDHYEDATRVNEANDGALAWLDWLKASGKQLDIHLSSIMLRTFEPRIYSLFAPVIRIPGHEYEWMHFPTGMNYYSDKWGGTDYAQKQQFPMATGERYRYSRIPIAPFVQKVTSDSATICWQASRPAQGVVDYGTSPGVYGSTASGVPTRTYHEIALSELQPHTRYYYQVRTIPDVGNIGGLWYHFETAPAAAVTPQFSFIVYGDTRRNPEHHAQVVASMTETASDAKLTLHVGDCVVDGRIRQDWEPNFFDIAAPISRHIPLYPAGGNHDYAEDSANYRDFFALPQNRTTPELFYSFDYGNSHFINLYVPSTGATTCDIGTPQYTWLEADLAANQNKEHIFVTLHSPLYSSSNHGSDVHLQTQLRPLFEQHHVEAVFSGHDHMYERSYPLTNGERDDENGVTYFVVGNGGAPLYGFSGSAPAWSAYRDATYYGFLKVEVNGSAVAYRAIDTSGYVMDSQPSQPEAGFRLNPVVLAPLIIALGSLLCKDASRN